MFYHPVYIGIKYKYKTYRSKERPPSRGRYVNKAINTYL